MSKFNLALLCDFYEFTMSNGYFQQDLKENISYFEIFFRQIPDGASFAIMAGLEQIIDYIQNLHFNDEDIHYLKKQGFFDENFLNFLKNFRFSGDIQALREGEIAFPYEPILSVKAKACEAQLLETFLLLSLNHQSLIATKANRIVRAAKGKKILEFAARRAQGADAALNGARAAFIGGCVASSCTLAGLKYGLKISGTMAHSWVQMFDDELTAFKHYCKLYPQNAVLLVDTYESIKGIKNAIKAFKAVFKDRKDVNLGIRLDSGNLCDLSQKARLMLDEAGLKHCKIIASGNLDEYKIQALLTKGAKIDAFGVGEKLISIQSASLGCVYKLVATEQNACIKAKIKISENAEKTTIPAVKKLYRFYDKKTGKALYDKLYIDTEKVQINKNTKALCLQVKIFEAGKLVYKKPSLNQIQNYVKKRLSEFDAKFLKLDEKHDYKVLLSPQLKALKTSLLQEQR